MSPPVPLGLSNSWQVAEVRCSLEIGLCEPGFGSDSRVSGRVSGRGFSWSSGVLAGGFSLLHFAVRSSTAPLVLGPSWGVSHPSTLNLIVFVDTSCSYVIPPCITNVIVILGVWNNILLFLLTQIFYYKVITLVIIFGDLFISYISLI